MLQATWASWQPGEIRVDHRADMAQHAVSIPIDMPAEWRYFLRLFPWEDQSLLLRCANANATSLYVLRDSETPVLVPDLPMELSSLPPYRVLPQAGGLVLGLLDVGLAMWNPGRALRCAETPAGMVVRDAVRSVDGRLWICGSLPLSRPSSMATRAGWAVSDDEGKTWSVQSHRANGLLDAWRGVLSGAAEEYRWIRVPDGCLVLAGLGGSSEDSSTLIMLRGRRGRWKSCIWPHDTFCGVATRDGHTAIFSHFGRVAASVGSARLRSDDITPTIQAACGLENIPDLRAELLNVEPSSAGSLIVAAFYARSSAGYSRHGEYVISFDNQNGTLITSHGHDEPEIVTAISL